MPLYSYGPADTNTVNNGCCRFETLQSMSEPELELCPTCGLPVVRLLAPFGIGSTPAHRAPNHPAPCAATCPTPCHSPSTSAGRIAEMATRHVCSAGCCHK